MDSANTNNSKNSSPASKKLKTHNTLTCTFQDGDFHTIELDVALTEVSVADVRKILAGRTVHEAEAIQLFSTDGEGRELTDDTETVAPGSQLQAIARDLQFELKSKLRQALAEKDHAGCWCWAVVCNELAMEKRHATSGDLMKLVQINKQHYAFLTRELSVPGEGNQIYLLHEHQFVLKWVKKGTSFLDSEKDYVYDGDKDLKFLRLRAEDVRVDTGLYRVA
jgi:hypothetical protein